MQLVLIWLKNFQPQLVTAAPSFKHFVGSFSSSIHNINSCGKEKVKSTILHWLSKFVTITKYVYKAPYQFTGDTLKEWSSLMRKISLFRADLKAKIHSTSWFNINCHISHHRKYYVDNSINFDQILKISIIQKLVVINLVRFSNTKIFTSYKRMSYWIDCKPEIWSKVIEITS